LKKDTLRLTGVTIIPICALIAHPITVAGINPVDGPSDWLTTAVAEEAVAIVVVAVVLPLLSMEHVGQRFIARHNMYLCIRWP
jgi:hypothetical protein